jgi:hypothetical protein
MAGGFGYERQPQAPSPDPREVGQRLRQQGGMQLNSRGPMAAGTPPEAAEEVDPSFDPQRQLGAVYMGGRGQMGTGSAPPGQPDYTDDDDVDANTTAAVGEALSRMGNGLMRPQNPHPARVKRRRDQLLQLGVTELEINLLSKSGGL